MDMQVLGLLNNFPILISNVTNSIIYIFFFTILASVGKNPESQFSVS